MNTTLFHKRLTLELFYIKQWMCNASFLVACALFIHIEWTTLALPTSFQLGQNLLLQGPLGESVLYLDPLVYVKRKESDRSCGSQVAEAIGFVSGHCVPEITDLLIFDFFEQKYISATIPNSTDPSAITALLALTGDTVSLVVREESRSGVVSLRLNESNLKRIVLPATAGVQVLVDLLLLSVPCRLPVSLTIEIEIRSAGIVTRDRALLLASSVLLLVYAVYGGSEFQWNTDSPVEFWNRSLEYFSFQFAELKFIKFFVAVVLGARTVWFMASHPRLSFLSKTISKGTDAILQFLFILWGIYSVLAFTAWISFGETLVGFSTFSNSLWTQFKCLLGQWDFLSLAVIYKPVLFVYLLAFLLAFLLLVMNVFQAVLITAFDESAARDKQVDSSVLEDGWIVIVETWKGWHEEWPSRQEILRDPKREIPSCMRRFYVGKFPILEEVCGDKIGSTQLLAESHGMLREIATRTLELSRQISGQISESRAYRIPKPQPRQEPVPAPTKSANERFSDLLDSHKKLQRRISEADARPRERAHPSLPPMSMPNRSAGDSVTFNARSPDRPMTSNTVSEMVECIRSTRKSV